MKFRDEVERDPEEYGYNIFLQKHLDKIYKKRKDIPEYKRSLELVRDLTQTPSAAIYKFKLKDLDVGEGFYTSDLDYVCNRVE